MTNHCPLLNVGCALTIALLLGGRAIAQEDAAPSAPVDSFKSKTEEVLLDVVVRDKKGHMVNDLKPEDFRILDNGEQKKIASFRLVQGGQAIASGGARTQLDPMRQVRLVTILFQCTANDARRLAHDAAVDLLKGELPQNVYMAVMTIDHKIEVLQPFTNDLALLRKAVDRATRSESKDFSADTAVVQKQLEEMIGQNTTGAQSQQEQIDNTNAVLAAQARTGNGAGMANMAMAQMVLTMLHNQQSGGMKDSGRTNIMALLDAVKEQYRLPGRKTVLYFREGGFVIPQGMEEPFNNVIDIANRSNVSLYIVDARGLTTVSANDEAMRGLKSAGRSSQDQFGDTGQATTAGQEGERAKALDMAVESTRSNTQNTLANLAESTGGTLIANTNDLKTPLRKLAEDIETYYEITYAPEIKNYDGSFHKIAVKVNSSDLRVQSRSGYIAIPPEMAHGESVHAYEIPLLAALSAPQSPRDFPFQSAALHFRGPQNKAQCVLAIDVPLANLTFTQKSPDQFQGRLSYVALVKNTDGQVVKKFQNDIPMNVPSTKMQALKSSHFIYTEEFDLSPGQYSVDTAVLDSEVNNKISARKSSLVIPAPSGAVAISSVSFIRNMKDKEPSTLETDPLLFGSKLISPALHPVVNKSGDAGLPFYLVGYMDKNIASPPKLVMEFSKDGQSLGQAAPELGKPDKDGRLQYVGTVPTASLDPGEYTIRFLLQQGSESAEEAAFFTVQ